MKRGGQTGAIRIENEGAAGLFVVTAAVERFVALGIELVGLDEAGDEPGGDNGPRGMEDGVEDRGFEDDVRGKLGGSFGGHSGKMWKDMTSGRKVFVFRVEWKPDEFCCLSM